MQQVAPWSNPVVMSHHSVAGSRETTLGWVLLLVASVTIVVVTVLLVIAIYRRSTRTAEAPVRGKDGLRWVMVGGIIVPSVVLGAVFVATVITQSAVAAPAGAGSLTIDVVGHRWWWELRYSGNKVVGANEIHIPTGTPVLIQLKAGDVIHSFWVPQLGGKTDLIPGRTNSAWIQADSAGVYRGQCAEFCGTQHARMAIAIVAENPGEFSQWLSRQQEPAESPTTPDVQAGMDAFMHSTCAGCHTIRGTPAKGVLGPDLTHLASRYTLAGGTLRNNQGNLAGWIGNPQALKPGSMMPTTPLLPAQLLSIVAYLQTLK